MKTARLLLILPLLGLTAPIWAHHSFTMFNSKNPIELEGIVEEFQFLNPHSWVMLKVTDEAGAQTVWALEFGPINMLSRNGWKADSLQPGDALRVRVEPMRDGSPAARLTSNAFLAGPDRIPETLAREAPPERPTPVTMPEAVAKDFNGIWLSAVRGLHFDTSVASGDLQQAPLTAEFQRLVDEKKALAAQGILAADPTAACTPAGFPRILSMVFPGEILQNENQLNWFAEWNQETVRIYLDGRSAPEGLLPSYTGFSTGHWEGNTLVTRTSHLRADTLIDNTGVPHSDQLQVGMRMTKLTPDYFEVEVTLTDPLALTRPWTATRAYKRAPPGYLAQEYSCFEGNKHRVNEDGTVSLDLSY